MGKKQVSLKITLCLFSILLCIIAIFYITFNYPSKNTFSFAFFTNANWDNSSNNKIFKDIIKLYEAENPGVKIKYWSGIRCEDYSEWLSQRILEGEMPDLCVVINEDFDILASNGLLEELSEITKNDSDFNLEDLYDTALASCRYQDKLYALPNRINPKIMFVNVSMLERAGLVMPSDDWTWDDLMEYCKILTRDSDGDGDFDQFGIMDFDWKIAVSTNNQMLFNSQGTEAYFNSDGVLAALEFVDEINKLADKDIPTEADFDNGDVAFRPISFSWYNTYKITPYSVLKDQFEWNIINLPKGPEGKNGADMEVAMLGISSFTQAKEEVWKFLKFIINDYDSQINLNKHSEGITSNKQYIYHIAEELSVSDYADITSVDEIKNKLNAAVVNSVIQKRFIKYSSCMDLADNLLYRALYEGANYKKTLENLNKQINEILQNSSIK